MKFYTIFIKKLKFENKMLEILKIYRITSASMININDEPFSPLIHYRNTFPFFHVKKKEHLNTN
jgi:hypothetical protein